MKVFTSLFLLKCRFNKQVQSQHFLKAYISWKISRHILCLLACTLLAGCSQTDLLDLLKGGGNKPPAGAIFTMTNDPEGNQIVAFARMPDGSLTFAGAYPTGGTGANIRTTEAGRFNPLDSQDPLILSEDRRFLFAVNAGSNEVVSMGIGEKGNLHLLDAVSSGGVTPNSLAAYKNLLYVANTGNGGSISGFYISASGKLTPIAGSTKLLSGLAGANGTAENLVGNIEFTPDGRFVIVSEKITNTLVVYTIDENGKPGDPLPQPSAGQTPFGAGFTGRGTFIVSEAFGNTPDGSAVSSYRVNPEGTLQVVSRSVATRQTASCWVELTDDEQYAFVSNAPAGTLSSMKVHPDGSLVLLEAVAGELGRGAFLLDAEITGKYLYVVAEALGEIAVYQISEGGKLTYQRSIKNDLLKPQAFTGLAGF